MRSVTRSVINFLKKEDGPTAVECALMLALVIVVCIVAINQTQLGPVVGDPVVVQTAQQ